MAILLIGVPLDAGPPLITRLVDQDDEVRVIESDSQRADLWRELGAHVAEGAWEEDLVERAAQNVRTMVVFDTGMDTWVLEQLLTGGRIAKVGRVVWITSEIDRGDLAVIERSQMDYIALATGRRGLLRPRSTVPPDAVAEAIDAADDLAGDPKLELDLTTAKAWRALRLERPGHG